MKPRWYERPITLVYIDEKQQNLRINFKIYNYLNTSNMYTHMHDADNIFGKLHSNNYYQHR